MFISAATVKAGRHVTGAKQAEERVAGKLERMGQERMLTRAEILEQVTCYKGCLSRGFYNALHELETLVGKTSRLILIRISSKACTLAG